MNLEVDPREHVGTSWARPQELYRKPDLIQGLYLILEDVYDTIQW